MKKNIFRDKTNFVILFLLPAFLGYLWEVFSCFFYYGNLSNRGFTYGPWLTVYGLGGLLFSLLLWRKRHKKIFCFFVCFLAGTLLELLGGLLLHYFFQLRYWDYSGWPLDFFGYISLYSSLGFGLAGMLWVCFLCPKFILLWTHPKRNAKRRTALAVLLYQLFLIDFIFSLFHPNQGSGITCLYHDISLFPI